MSSDVVVVNVIIIRVGGGDDRVGQNGVRLDDNTPTYIYDYTSISIKTMKWHQGK